MTKGPEISGSAEQQPSPASADVAEDVGSVALSEMAETSPPVADELQAQRQAQRRKGPANLGSEETNAAPSKSQTFSAKMAKYWTKKGDLPPIRSPRDIHIARGFLALPTTNTRKRDQLEEAIRDAERRKPKGK